MAKNLRLMSEQTLANDSHSNPLRVWSEWEWHGLHSSPRILLKIVGLTCIVSVFLTILTCYVCKRYWKRSDSGDNQVYRVSGNTSSSPHVFPLESLQPLNPNAFFKSPEHVANLCGDLALFSTSQTQPTQLRAVFASSRATPSALCSYQHNINNLNTSHSLIRPHRNHEPPPPYQLSVISGTATTAPTSVASVSGGSGGVGGAGNSNTDSVAVNNVNNEMRSEQICVSPESDCNPREATNTEVKIPLSECSHTSEPQQSIAFDILPHHRRDSGRHRTTHSGHSPPQSRLLRRMSQW